MSVQDRKHIDECAAKLVSVGEMTGGNKVTAEAAVSLLSQLLKDVNRIADALDKSTPLTGAPN